MVYKVVFDVRTPIITNTPIHFDALLSAVHPAMHNGYGLTRRSGAESVVTAPLPIDSVKINDTWMWCCSTADYADAKPYTDKITKRKDGVDYFYIDGRQTPRTGPGRDRCDTVYGVSCSAVSFLASTADVKELNRICQRVNNIGGLRKMGYGEVTQYRIDETNLRWEDCVICGGVAIRNIPAEMLENNCLNRVCTKDPYWLPANLHYGVQSGEKAKLKPEVWLNAYRSR